jgi:GntR family transcriptional regulator
LARLGKPSFDPLYYQIEREILGNINLGHLQPGDRLPSETEIVQQYQVSRITARRVLEDLVKQGVAYSQQGRGTFIAVPRIREVSGFLSYSEDIRARGLIPSSQVLFFDLVDLDEAMQKKMQTKPGEKAFCLKRIRLADNKPMVIETAYLPTSLCPQLMEEDFSTSSLYCVLREKFGIYPTWADAEIVAGQATPEEAVYLGMQPGMPVLCADRLTYTRTYTVIESVRSVYCGDRFSFYTGRQFIG